MLASGNAIHPLSPKRIPRGPLGTSKSLNNMMTTEQKGAPTTIEKNYSRGKNREQSTIEIIILL
jgi:hypothetical protein